MDSACVNNNHNQYCVIDKEMSYSPRTATTLRGYGNIVSVKDDDKMTQMKSSYDLIQPLCGEFGEHYPAKTTMEKSQHKLAWDNTVVVTGCGYQNQHLNESQIGVNSQLPTPDKTNTIATEAFTSSRMAPASYYSTTGEFHNAKC